MEILEQLGRQNEKLEKEIHLLKNRFNSLNVLKTEDSKSIQLKSLMTRQNVYKNQSERLKLKISTFPSSEKLEEMISTKEAKIKKLEHTNRELNRHRPSIVTTERPGTLIKEIMRIRKTISELETRNERTHKSLNLVTQKVQELGKEYTNLSEIPIQELRGNNVLSKKKKALLNKLGIVQHAKETSQAKLENQIKELENELVELNSFALKLKTQALKKGQQARMLHLQQKEFDFGYSTINQSHGKSKDKFWEPDVEFIYQPTVKKIYY